MEADMAWKFHVNTSSRETNFPLVGSKQAQQRELLSSSKESYNIGNGNATETANDCTVIVLDAMF